MMPLMLTTISGCKKDKENPGTGVFLFSLEDDKALGAKVDAEIKASGEFTILDRATNIEAYAYMDAMRDEILNSGTVKFKDEFEWQLNIIDNDTTLNAFCTPGGYIYFYTGLIKYLENSSSLAGVLGHEMAHADRRHSMASMQEQFGVSLVLQIISGDEEPGMLAQIAASLTSLSFSRKHEKEADKYSVQYLCQTDFDAAGAANFFQKLLDSGAQSPPAFLSTHPSPASRVQNIHDEANSKSCAPGEENPEVNGTSYETFKALF